MKDVAGAQYAYAVLPGLDAAAQARAYAAGGAAACSVLTDGPFFGGSLADLARVRGAVQVPLLRKDFILHPAQIYQARLAGADALLLIAAALEPEQLAALYAEALALGLTPLIEVHAAQELPPVLVGVNNRDLKTLAVDLGTCLRLRPLIPASTLVVAESGIRGPQDVARLQAGGLDAFLVGTLLMRASDPQAAVAALAAAGARP